MYLVDHKSTGWIYGGVQDLNFMSKSQPGSWGGGGGGLGQKEAQGRKVIWKEISRQMDRLFLKLVAPVMGKDVNLRGR